MITGTEVEQSTFIYLHLTLSSEIILLKQKKKMISLSMVFV